MWWHKKQKLFQWHGINHHGEQRQGEISASNRHELITKLENERIVLLHALSSKKNTKMLSTTQVIHLIEQWLYSLNSGIPINETLQLLCEQKHQSTLHTINKLCLSYVKQGKTLSEALHNINAIKPSWIINYIAAGEQQGDLIITLQNLKQQLTKQQDIKQQFKKALFYPCSVIVFAIMTAIALLILVIPQFESIYQQLQAELPWITQCAIACAQQLKAHGVALIISLAALVVTCITLLKCYPNLHYYWHRSILAIPLIAPLNQHANLSRWCGLLSLLITSGITIDRSLQLATQSLSNLYLKQQLDKTVEVVQQGYHLHHHLKTIHHFPTLDQRLIAIAEATGQLSQVSLHLANQHQQALEHLSHQISRWLEPMIMLLLAIFVGGLVIAIYAPIFNLGNIL